MWVIFLKNSETERLQLNYSTNTDAANRRTFSGFRSFRVSLDSRFSFALYQAYRKHLLFTSLSSSQMLRDFEVRVNGLWHW